MLCPADDSRFPTQVNCPPHSAANPIDGQSFDAERPGDGRHPPSGRSFQSVPELRFISVQRERGTSDPGVNPKQPGNWQWIADSIAVHAPLVPDDDSSGFGSETLHARNQTSSHEYRQVKFLFYIEIPCAFRFYVTDRADEDTLSVYSRESECNSFNSAILRHRFKRAPTADGGDGSLRSTPLVSRYRSSDDSILVRIHR